MKTLAQLKRDVKVGTKMTLLERFGTKMNDPKEVCHVQGNAIAFAKGDKKSWLSWPQASLIEYTGSEIKIYSAGLRDLSAEEQRIIDTRPVDAKQSMIDIMSDGSTMFWKCKRHFKDHDAMWYYNWHKGLKYDSRTGRMYDKSIKGQLELHYRIEEL